MTISGSIQNPLGAIDTLERVEAVIGSIPAAVGPIAASSGPAVVPRRNSRSSEAPIAASANRSNPIDTPNNSKEEDSSLTFAMLLFGEFAKTNADENGNVSSSAITTFVNELEKLGMNVEPLKRTLEEVSGQSWSQLSGPTNTNTQFDLSNFYSERVPGGSRITNTMNTGFDSLRAIRISQTDNAAGGYCAKGVANIAEGLGWDVQRGHATEWDRTLPQNGWVRLRGVDPRNAPEGAVLVFDSDLERGRAARNNGGGRYGHVEFVVKGRDGETQYVSDRARDNFGGSVPNNFSGAFMYVGPGAPPENRAIVAAANSPVSRGPSLENV